MTRMQVLKTTGDYRDFTPDPPAILDPLWILKMRQRVKAFISTGDLAWYMERAKKWPVK